jgi:hypothetical protein
MAHQHQNIEQFSGYRWINMAQHGEILPCRLWSGAFHFAIIEYFLWRFNLLDCTGF